MARPHLPRLAKIWFASLCAVTLSALALAAESPRQKKTSLRTDAVPLVSVHRSKGTRIQ
jgi:hypothetical protein